jgi:hypothetical protein
MDWQSVIFCVAVSVLAITAYCGLLTARRALHHSAILETLLATASQRVMEVETELATLRGKTTALFSRVEQLSMRQARFDSIAGKAGFDEAIAIAQRGANARELIDTCGLSQGEARLVEVLYGTDKACPADLHSHEATASEAH